MNEVRRSFDWLAFLVRVLVIAALATCLLVERMNRHDRVGVALVIGIGYVILPAVAYLHTRFYNSIFMVRIIAAVKRISGRVAKP
ncbi:MAG TPA: hypothetical protein VMJ93_03935 [Verrucomicrobiae bacterium]|nr:hypothetical protein [Verrucomicrobiae bacterium]